MQLITQKVHVFDQELEEKLNQKRIELMPTMLVSGRQHGLEGKILTPRHLQTQVINPIKSSLEPLLALNYQKHRPIAELGSVNDIRMKAEKEMEALVAKANNAEKRYEVLTNERKAIREQLECKMARMLRIAIPTLLGLLEGALTGINLVDAAMPLPYIVVIALAVAVASGFGLHFAADYIEKATTSKVKRRRTIIILAVGLVAAVGLGLWRAATQNETLLLNAQVAGEAIETSPLSVIPFVIVSYLLFLVALGFELHYWLSPQQRKLHKAYGDKTREAGAAKAEWLKLKSEAETISAEASQACADALNRQEYAKGYEDRVVALAGELQDHYECSYLDHSQNNKCPEYFGQAKKFDFALPFTQLFNKKTKS